jgi:hypothetical protein
MRSLVWPLFGYERYIGSGSDADSADISGRVMETRHLIEVALYGESNQEGISAELGLT